VKQADTGPIDSLLTKAKRAAESRRLDEAEALLLQVLTLCSDNLKALDLLGFVRFFQGRYEECEKLCLRALEIKPDHAYAMSGLGMSLARQHKLDEGIAMLERAMATSPAWPEPYWDAAVILFEAGETVRAEAILQKGLQCAPKSHDRFEKLLSTIRQS
jgi:tetratricopeptide (TPR) repeat protein